MTKRTGRGPKTNPAYVDKLRMDTEEARRRAHRLGIEYLSGAPCNVVEQAKVGVLYDNGGIGIQIGIGQQRGLTNSNITIHAMHLAAAENLLGFLRLAIEEAKAAIVKEDALEKATETTFKVTDEAIEAHRKDGCRACDDERPCDFVDAMAEVGGRVERMNKFNMKL